MVEIVHEGQLVFVINGKGERVQEIGGPPAEALTSLSQRIAATVFSRIEAEETARAIENGIEIMLRSSVVQVGWTGDIRPISLRPPNAGQIVEVILP